MSEPRVRVRGGSVRVAAAVALLVAGTLSVAIGGAGLGARPAGATTPIASFSCTGSTLDAPLPVGDYAAVWITVAGAQGGASLASVGGGPGGGLSALVPATPGDVLTVRVGCPGQNGGSVRGDGRGGFGDGRGGDASQSMLDPPGFAGGGGGGATRVVDAHGRWTVVGGGGGGAGGAGTNSGYFGGVGGGGGHHPQAGQAGNNGNFGNGGCGGCADGANGTASGPLNSTGLFNGTAGGGGGGCRGGRAGAVVGEGGVSGASGGGGGGSSCTDGALNVVYKDASNWGGGFVTITPATYVPCDGQPHAQTVPASADRAAVVGAGAQGADGTKDAVGAGAEGGAGGRAGATFRVAAGHQVDVIVGCRPAHADGGFGGHHGGPGGTGGTTAGGGGGATTVTSASDGWSLTGGGGGGGGATDGGLLAGPGGRGGHGGQRATGGTNGGGENPGIGGAPAATADGIGGRGGEGPGQDGGGPGGGGGGGCQGGGGGSTAVFGGGGGGGGGTSCITGAGSSASYEDGVQTGDGFAQLVFGSSATARPDARVGSTGDGVYDASGAGQVSTQPVGAGPAEHEITIENDGAGPALITMQLPAPVGGFRAEYELTEPGGNESLLPEGANDTLLLAPGETATLRARISAAGAPEGASYTGLVHVSSVDDPTVADAVQLSSPVVAIAPPPPLPPSGPGLATPASPIRATPRFTG